MLAPAECIDSSSQLRVEKALNQLAVKTQADPRGGSRKSTQWVNSVDESDEGATRKLLQSLESLGIPESVAIFHKAFIIDWIRRAIDEGRLEQTGRPSDKEGRKGQFNVSAGQELYDAILDGEPAPPYDASELELVTRRLAATPLTIRARLVAVIDLVSSYRQESFERDHRSDSGNSSLNKATKLLEEVLSAAENSEMPEADRIPWLTAMWNLGILYRDTRDYPSAEEVLRRVCQGWDSLVGNYAEQTLRAACVLAGVYELAGGVDEAEATYLESLDAAQHQIGSNADITLRIMIATARYFMSIWKGQEAESLYQEVYSRSIKSNGGVSGFTAGIAHQLGVCYSREGKLNEAVTMLSTAHTVLLRLYGSKDPGTISSARMLGNTYFKLQAFDKARDSWAIAISGHKALGTLETPLGDSLLNDCLTLGQQLGHANAYSWKIRRDPLGFMKTLGLAVDENSLNMVGRSGQLNPPVTSLPFIQRGPLDNYQDTGKQSLRAEQIKARSEDDHIAAIASITGTGALESPDWSPRWLDSDDSEFSAQNVLQAAREWKSLYLPGIPESAQTVLAGTLDFSDTERDGPPHQLVTAFRTALLSLPQIQFKESSGAFRCMWNYSVVVEVNFVKALVGGIYGLQFRKRGSAIKHGDAYYGLWMKVWDEVLSPRVTDALHRLRKGNGETRLERVQLLLKNRLRDVNLMKPT